MNKNITELGPREAEFLARMASKTNIPFTIHEAFEFWGNRDTARKKLSFLERKGWLERIERGRYLVVPLEAGTQRQWSKNPFFSFFLQLIFYFFIFDTASGQQNAIWRDISPQVGFPIKAMVQDTTSGTLFCITQDSDSSRVYRSTDKGSSWVEISILPRTVYCLAIDGNNPSVLYTGVRSFNTGIFKSIDGGLTWSLAPLYQARVYDIVVNPSHSDIVYACGDHKETVWIKIYYKSTDRGTNWSSQFDPTDNGSGYNAIAVDPVHPDTLYLCGYKYRNDPIMYKSTDGGTTWADISSGLKSGCHDVALNPSSSRGLYASTDYGIFKLSEGDTSWTVWSREYAAVYALAVDTKNVDVVYGVATDSVFKSFDGGLNWVSIPLGISGGECVEIIVDKDFSNILYLANEAGFFKSTDSGIHWSHYRFTGSQSNISALKVAASSPATLYAAVQFEGIYKTENSLDKGFSAESVEWEKLESFEGSTWIADIEVDPSNSNKVYALGGERYNSLLYFSSNGGYVWDRMDDESFNQGVDLTLGSIYAGGMWDHDNNTSTLWVMAVFQSVDNGTSWNRYILNATGGLVNSIAVHPTNTDIIYAGGYYRGTYGGEIPSLKKTINGGSNWTEIGSSFSRKLTVVRIDPFNHDKIYVGTEKDPVLPWGGVYVSTDGGATWQPPNQGYDIRCMVMDPTTSGRLFIGTSTGVYMSTDGATSWEGMNDGLLNTDVNCIDFDPVNNVLYAGTNGSGVFRYMFTTGVEDTREDILPPASAVLFPNYPNPFNMSTTLQYDLPQSGPVKISIYDIHGRLVRVLKDRHETAGVKRVIWDGKDRTGTEISSGVYVVRLETLDNIQMQKIVLQK